MRKYKKDTRLLLSKEFSINTWQAVSTYSTGAMVDFRNQTLMTAAPETWSINKDISIAEPRLENQLDVECFYSASPNIQSDFDENSNVNDENRISFVRFPEWHFCPVCKRFKPLSEWMKEGETRVPRCSSCKVNLVPAAIVTVCENGHINDFPWIQWVHNMVHKEICKNPSLKIVNSTSSQGLEGFVVECKCGAKASLRGAFNKGIFNEMYEKYKLKEYKCSGRMPWKGKKEECASELCSIQRGALNIYFPYLVSSLSIPSPSERVKSEVLKSRKFHSLRDQLEDEDIVKLKGKENIIESFITKISDEIDEKNEAVSIVLHDYFNNENDNGKLTKEEFRWQEYNAIKGNIPVELRSVKDFKIDVQKNIDDYKIPYLKSVVLVKKLREVKAIVGFSRLEPIDRSIFSGFEDDKSKINGFISIKEKSTPWYPAYESRGEGIFIEIDDEAIEKWSMNPKVKARIDILKNRYKNCYSESKRIITPKFVLLHTLSHLFIKELSFKSGYSSTALTERIYCNEENEKNKMSGILIYTAAGDSEGTLGGLVRQGKSDMLSEVIREAVRKAEWCSYDPVCIESKAQGRKSLNLSACYACTLISETSCEEYNTLLDRALIVGTLEDKDIGFFNNMV